MIDSFFDKVYIITLPSRIKYVRKFIHKYTKNAEIIEALYYPNHSNQEIINSFIENDIILESSKLSLPKIWCHLSHLKTLTIFLKSSAKNCIIFEDDVYSDLSPMELEESFLNFFHNLPKDYELLLFGYCWDNCDKHKKLNEWVKSPYYPKCRHAYSVNREGARKILQTLPMNNLPGDKIIGKLIQNNQIQTYIPNKPFFFQNRKSLKTTLGNYDSAKICTNL